MGGKVMIWIGLEVGASPFKGVKSPNHYPNHQLQAT